MAAVQTIAGPVDSAELGPTLGHEHLCSGMAGMERLGLYDPAEALRRNIDALTTVHAAGVRTIIDCTPIDLGRQATFFEALAPRSPVHVIAATGVYRFIPLTYNTWSADTLAAHFLRELEEGMEGTAIRAGVIKIAWDLEYRLDEGAHSPRELLEKVARAAGRAARAAGVPVICHHRTGDRTGPRLLDIFEEEGVNLRAVTIAHCNDAPDSDYIIDLARRGATVGLDRFNRHRVDEDELRRRCQLAAEVIAAGFAEQMTLSHDRASYSVNNGPAEGGPRAEDPRCFMDVLELELPYLRAHGAVDADIDAVMTGSVRATFEAAAGMRSR